MEKLHWLWPTLIMESSIQVDDVQSFNARLLETIISIATDPSKQLWEMETPEINTLKSEFDRCTSAWLRNANLEGKFERQIDFGWLNVYQPGQFIPPHHHQNFEIITLYYLTDETATDQFQTVPPMEQLYEMDNRPGCTAFHDPRGAIEFRESAPVVEFSPVQGRLVTTPGHIIHWTVPSDKLRAIIVSNPKFKRVLQ
jgi:hypothetical protein